MFFVNLLNLTFLGKLKSSIWASVSVCGLNPFSIIANNHESEHWCGQMALTCQSDLPDHHYPSSVCVLSWIIQSRYLQTLVLRKFIDTCIKCLPISDILHIQV